MALDITSYAGLLSTVTAWVGGSSDPQFTEILPIAVQLAEEEIGNTLRTPENIVRATLDVDSEWETLPPGCKKLQKVWLQDTTPERNLPDLTYGRAAYNDGLLRGYKLHGMQIGLVPWTDGTAVTIHLAYYTKPEALAGTDACTAVLGAYPSIYLYGTLKNLEGFLVGDQRIPLWASLFNEKVAQANELSVMRGSELGG